MVSFTENSEAMAATAITTAMLRRSNMRQPMTLLSFRFSYSRSSHPVQTRTKRPLLETPVFNVEGAPLSVNAALGGKVIPGRLVWPDDFSE